MGTIRYETPGGDVEELSGDRLVMTDQETHWLVANESNEIVDAVPRERVVSVDLRDVDMTVDDA